MCFAELSEVRCSCRSPIALDGARMRSAKKIVVLLLSICVLATGQAGEENSLRSQLALFGSPVDEEAEELKKLLDKLESDDFKERADSLRTLASRPLLPESVLILAETHPVLEVRYRLKELRDDPERIANAKKMLEKLLGEVQKKNVRGLTDVVIGALPMSERAELLPAAETALLITSTVADQEVLIAAMGNDYHSDNVRRSLIPALGKIGGEEVMKALVGAADSQNSRLRVSAAYELAKLGRPEELMAVGNLLESDEMMVRWHSIAALREVTGQHFGYGPGGTAEKRAGAVEKWKSWLRTVGPVKNNVDPM